jgi:hypothetical protein
MDPLTRLVRGNAADNGLEALNERLDALEKSQAAGLDKVSALTAIFDHALKSSLRTARAAQVMRKWVFDARMPNTVFEQIGLPDRDEDGRWMRWISRRSAVTGTFTDLPRNVQYEFTVDVTAFPNEDAMNTFHISADGLPLPWLEIEKSQYRTIIPTSSRDGLVLELGVSPVASQSAGGRAFAFSRMTLIAR